jgi:hypothetical protein
LTILLLTALCLIGCSSSPGTSPGTSFEGEITAKLAEELDSNNMKLKLDYNNMSFKIKANLFRLEFSNNQGKVGLSGATIMDLKSGIQRTINAEEKTYSELDMTKFKIPVDDDAEAKNFPKITRTGKTETIAGYTCEYYQFGDQEKLDFCLTKGLGYIPSGNDYRGGLINYFNNKGLHKPLETDPEFKKLVESGAFPLKITYEENGQVKTYMEVTRIDRKSLADSLFQVPADYKKVELPGFPMER